MLSALSPDQYLKLITFDGLSLGETFEFTPRINLTAILDLTKAPQDIGTYIENRKVTRWIGNFKDQIRRVR